MKKPESNELKDLNKAHGERLYGAENRSDPKTKEQDRKEIDVPQNIDENVRHDFYKLQSKSHASSTVETKGKESSYFPNCSFVPVERTGCDKEMEYNSAVFFRVCVYKGDILKSKAKAVWCGQDSSLQNPFEMSFETNWRIGKFWKKKNENGSYIFDIHEGSASHNSEIFRNILKFVDMNKIESLALPLSLTGYSNESKLTLATTWCIF